VLMSVASPRAERFAAPCNYMLAASLQGPCISYLNVYPASCRYPRSCQIHKPFIECSQGTRTPVLVAAPRNARPARVTRSPSRRSLSLICGRPSEPRASIGHPCGKCRKDRVAFGRASLKRNGAQRHRSVLLHASPVPVPRGTGTSSPGAFVRRWHVDLCQAVVPHC
jgi:hypothetical protein